MVFEPIDGVLGLESVEGAEEFTVTAGVICDKSFGIEAVVSDVAAATSGDFDFGEEMGRFFREEDVGVGIGLSGCDCAEEACCTTTDY